MGYDIKLILGRTTDQGSEQKWFRVSGTLEIGRCNDNQLGKLKDVLEKNETGATEVFIYESDGDTKCYKDRYDNALVPTLTWIVAEALEQDNKIYENEELEAIIPFLREISKNPYWHNCIIFGH